MESEERDNSLNEFKEEEDEQQTIKKSRLDYARTTTTEENKIEQKVSSLESCNRVTSEQFPRESYEEDLSSSFSELEGGDGKVKEKQLIGQEKKICENMCSDIAISNITGDNSLTTCDEILVPGINRDKSAYKSTPYNDFQQTYGDSNCRNSSDGKERVGKTTSVEENRQRIIYKDGDRIINLSQKNISPRTPKSQKTQTLMDFIRLQDPSLSPKLTDSSYAKCTVLTLGKHVNESVNKSSEPIVQKNVVYQSSKKDQESNKKSKVQRTTEPGKEFQRLLQILIRNRALKSGGCEVGTEVTGVGCLDDVVYLNNNLNQSRYFQAKYNAIQTVKVSDLFSTKSDELNEFCLLRFYKAFYNINKIYPSALSETEEFVFITKREVDCELTAEKNVRYLEEIIQQDEILNLSTELASIYKLNANIIVQHQTEVVKMIQNKYNSEVSDIREFFSKIRLVFCFLDTDNNKLINDCDINTTHGNIDGNRRIFYIPYSLGKMIEAQELIRSNYSKSHLKDYGLQVMLYFPSFVKIKTNPEFMNHEIKEITFITNRKISDSSLLILEEVHLEDDDCLHIVSSKARKFKFSENIQAISKTFFANLENPPDADLVGEFMDKTALVTYPEVKWLRRFVLNEVFDENIYSTISKDILNRHLLHIELELLSTKQFTSCEEWRCKVDELKKMVAYLKAKGVTDFNKNTVRIDLQEDIEFEDTREVLQDVQELLKMDDNSVLNMIVQDKKLNSLLIFQILGDIINEKNSLLNDYQYHGLHDLRVAPFSIDSFKESVPLMVVLCTDLPEEQSTIVNIVDQLGDVINAYNKKLIVISGTEDIALLNALQNKITNNVISKSYQHGFNSLNNASKEKILSKEIHFQGSKYSLSQLLNNDKNLASKIIDESIICDVLTNQKNLLIFGHQINSKRYNEVKEYLIPMKAEQRYLNEKKNEIEFDKVVELLELEKINVPNCNVPNIYILAAKSGAGKSTVLTSMALKIQEIQNPNVWVAKVELRQFFDEIKSLRDLDTTEKTIEIACQMILGTHCKDRLDFKLLKELLTTDEKGNFKIVLFFDGYNEIKKQDQIETCCLIKTLEKKCNVTSIWVATQEHSTKGLQKNLRTYPYIINKLTEHDQVKLMTQYWAVQHHMQSCEFTRLQELSSYARNTLGKWNTYIMDNITKSFTEVAFNVIMLADVLMDKDSKEPKQNIKLSTLYDKFVNKKFTVYDRETSGLELQSSGTITIYKNCFIQMIRKVLQQIAAEYIFKQYKKGYNAYKTLPGIGTIQELKRTIGEADYLSMLTKLGIVISVEDKVYFSHESYAQYFFSEYIFYNRGNTIVQNFVTKHVLTLDDFKLCRILINTKLRQLFAEESQQKDNKGTNRIKKETSPGKVKTARQDMDKLKNTWNEIVIKANKEKLESILAYLLKNLTKYDLDELLPSITSKLIKHFKLDTAQENRVYDKIQKSKENLKEVAMIIVKVGRELE